MQTTFDFQLDDEVDGEFEDKGMLGRRWNVARLRLEGPDVKVGLAQNYADTRITRLRKKQ